MQSSLAEVRRTPPAATEHAPFYATYISKVAPGDVVESLRAQAVGTLSWLGRLAESQGAIRYAPDKWSVRQVIGHLLDAERVFTFRAMCFARADATELPGFDENAYVANARFDDRSLAGLVAEWRAVRDGSIAFFDTLNAEEFVRSGVANKKPISVRALAWIIAGHEVHHVAILRERYGV